MGFFSYVNSYSNNQQEYKKQQKSVSQICHNNSTRLVTGNDHCRNPIAETQTKWIVLPVPSIRNPNNNNKIRKFLQIPEPIFIESDSRETKVRFSIKPPSTKQ
ncbi:hypothetical protein U1Q18_016497 [Sarracenia purpurea var. burkii]